MGPPCALGHGHMADTCPMSSHSHPPRRATAQPPVMAQTCKALTSRQSKNAAGCPSDSADSPPMHHECWHRASPLTPAGPAHLPVRTSAQARCEQPPAKVTGVSIVPHALRTKCVGYNGTPSLFYIAIHWKLYWKSSVHNKENYEGSERTSLLHVAREKT